MVRGHRPAKGSWRLSLALRMSLLLERLRQPLAIPKSPPALVREYSEARGWMCLEVRYYAAKQETGFTLIPWDDYMNQVEAALTSAAEPS